ncbi:helix-turn-helix transcriptional regulator [Arthrobacter sp. 179]|uniref:helix-turn-helix transcriptional regulator n=1 Tax=Arthrobacter sp. 179 TaxID=3457734 RepID=UPI0040333266
MSAETEKPRGLVRPDAVAEYLGVSTASLAQQRYLGTGPKFVRVNTRTVRYRWDDVEEFLNGQTFERTDKRVAQ